MAYATVNGVTLHYRETGQGPTVLFLHGFPFDHTMWLDQMGALAHLRRSIAMDLRGFGRSGRRFNEPLTMERHAEDAAALLGSLGVDQVDVVAMSMGGYVALALWEQQPELFRTLTLIDTKAAADSEEGKEGRDAAAAKLVDVGKDAWGGDLVKALVAEQASIQVRARLRSMIGRTSYDTIVAALAGMRDRPDRTAVLDTITVPTLLLVGEHDALTPPSEATAMAEAIPGAQVAVVPGAGHVSPLENAPLINEALLAFFADPNAEPATAEEPETAAEPTPESSAEPPPPPPTDDDGDPPPPPPPPDEDV